MSILNIDYLKKNHTKIHAFGLGFIQLKLSQTTRVHFYVPEVNKTGGDTEVHNHRYDFMSQILKGQLHNEIYIFEPSEDGDCEMVDEACSKDRPASTKAPISGSVNLLSTQTMQAGSHYLMRMNTLHMVRTERAVTLLYRDPPPYRDFAQVVKSKKADLVCPFSANLPEKDLWEIVEREIKDAY